MPRRAAGPACPGACCRRAVTRPRPVRPDRVTRRRASRSTSSPSTRPRRSATRSERAVGRRDHRRRLEQHRRHAADRRGAGRARRADRVQGLRRPAQPRASRPARGDWIFSLDSDERCTPEVRDEVMAIVGRPTRSTSTACRGATGSWAAGSAIRAGTRTTASRSCSAAARWPTRSSRCTRATALRSDGEAVVARRVRRRDLASFRSRPSARSCAKLNRYSERGARQRGPSPASASTSARARRLALRSP